MTVCVEILQKKGLEHAFEPATLLFTVVPPFLYQSFSIFTNHESIYSAEKLDVVA
jgi:hypothetical protein